MGSLRARRRRLGLDSETAKTSRAFRTRETIGHDGCLTVYRTTQGIGFLVQRFVRDVFHREEVQVVGVVAACR
jgi:hypothetical protein